MISVCMATYNGERFIKRQLESILSQLAADDEVVISDDGSTDKTLEVIAALGDKRVRVLHHKPCGVPFNFENAIKAAKGEYIFLSDQDDIWLPGKVAKCRAAFESGADLVLHNAEVTDGEGRQIMPETFFDLKHTALGFWRNWKRNAFIGCCMAFRASLVPRFAPFPRHITMHDEWIGLYMSYIGAKVALIAEPLIKYCQHESNASNCVYKSKNSLLWKLRKRATFLWYCVTHKEEKNMNKSLVGHMTVWGLIMAGIMGLAIWETGVNLHVNPKVYNDDPIALTWKLAPGQEALAANIKSFRVYYKTYDDNTLSERQKGDVAFKPADPYGLYMVKLPPRVTGFRLDTYCTDRKSPTVEQPPKLAALAFDSLKITNHIKSQTEHRLRFSSWLYDVPLFLNGWGARLISAAIIVWLLCMTGLYFLLRKSLSRQ